MGNAPDLGNLDTWNALGNLDTYKIPLDRAIDKVKEVGNAIQSGAQSLGDSTNWKNAFENPQDVWESQTKPWIQSNHVLSNAVSLAGDVGVPLGAMAASEAIRNQGYGLKRFSHKACGYGPMATYRKGYMPARRPRKQATPEEIQANHKRYGIPTRKPRLQTPQTTTPISSGEQMGP